MSRNLIGGHLPQNTEQAADASNEPIEVKLIAAASDGYVRVTPEKCERIRKLLAAAPASTDCESVAGKTTEAVTQGCRAPDLPQAPAPTPAPPQRHPNPDRDRLAGEAIRELDAFEGLKRSREPVLTKPIESLVPPAEPAVPEREPPRSMWPDDLTICRKCKRDMLTNRHAVDIWGQIACLPNVSWREQCDALAERPLRAEEEK